MTSNVIGGTPRLTKLQWMLMGVSVALYCLGYAWARSEHILVHAVSFATDGNNKSYHHRVITADFGPGLLQHPETPYVVSTCYWLFTPLRWLEAAAWHLIPRQYAV